MGTGRRIIGRAKEEKKREREYGRNGELTGRAKMRRCLDGGVGLSLDCTDFSTGQRGCERVLGSCPRSAHSKLAHHPHSWYSKKEKGNRRILYCRICEWKPCGETVKRSVKARGRKKFVARLCTRGGDRRRCSIGLFGYQQNLWRTNERGYWLHGNGSVVLGDVCLPLWF